MNCSLGPPRAIKGPGTDFTGWPRSFLRSCCLVLIAVCHNRFTGTWSLLAPHTSCQGAPPFKQPLMFLTLSHGPCANTGPGTVGTRQRSRGEHAEVVGGGVPSPSPSLTSLSCPVPHSLSSLSQQQPGGSGNYQLTRVPDAAFTTAAVTQPYTDSHSHQVRAAHLLPLVHLVYNPG